MCPELVDSTGFYCEKHAPKRRRKADEQRAATDEEVQSDGKFYRTSVWQNMRLLHLHRFPLCNECGAPGRVVDHIIPLRQGGARLDENNLQTMCDRCHNSKRGREAKGASTQRGVLSLEKRGLKFLGNLTLVVGRPGSGKSRWVKAQARWGDLVWDFDQVCAVIAGGLPLYDKPPEVVAAAIDLRDEFIFRLTRRHFSRAYLIECAPPPQRVQNLKAAGATVVLVTCEANEAVLRISQDPHRSHKWKQFIPLVESWAFDSALADVITPG